MELESRQWLGQGGYSLQGGNTPPTDDQIPFVLDEELGRVGSFQDKNNCGRKQKQIQLNDWNRTHPDNRYIKEVDFLKFVLQAIKEGDQRQGSVKGDTHIYSERLRIVVIVNTRQRISEIMDCKDEEWNKTAIMLQEKIKEVNERINHLLNNSNIDLETYTQRYYNNQEQTISVYKAEEDATQRRKSSALGMISEKSYEKLAMQFVTSPSDETIIYDSKEETFLYHPRTLQMAVVDFRGRAIQIKEYRRSGSQRAHDVLRELKRKENRDIDKLRKYLTLNIKSKQG